MRESNNVLLNLELLNLQNSNLENHLIAHLVETRFSIEDINHQVAHLTLVLHQTRVNNDINHIIRNFIILRLYDMRPKSE
jgi:hypothetical protein